MDAYTDFATVYDTFMDETPYAEWETQIKQILYAEEIRDGIVLDLGCGTGNMTELLARDGYDMIGVDLSIEMLDVARRKQMESGLDILYLCQDMREFELYGTVRAVVMVCDSINYLLEDEDIINTFRLVNNYLDSRGLFIFDFNTVHKYRDVIGERVIAENRDNCSFIWENYYDSEERINEYQLTIFVREDLLEGAFEADEENAAEENVAEENAAPEDAAEEDAELVDATPEDVQVENVHTDVLRYIRTSEQHFQKGYELAQMQQFLEAAGMEFVRAYDTDTQNEVTDLSERITVVAREKYTEGKFYNNHE
ncbi:MAG: class I SAM-dependent DNA methyltransferase [Lachnospiraceae bacterium]